MGTLFWKECKIHIKSLLFFVYILLLTLFFLSQFWDFPVVVKPRKNANGYGMTVSDDPQIIMNKTMERLLEEFIANRYITYPVGFYKRVTLNEEKQEKVCHVIEEVTGLSIEEAMEVYLHYWEEAPEVSGDENEDWENSEEYQREHPFEMLFAKDMDYEIFEESMGKVNKILGGGSYYAKDQLPGNAYIPMTYEQALEEYESIVRDDKVTGAYARLFCDYMGLMLGMLPVFLAVSRELRDRKSKAALVIYSKKYSSLRIIGARYAAILVISVLPILVFGIILLAYALLQANSIGAAYDIPLYFAYLGSWLLPTVMFTISLGMLCSVLTENILGILLQGLVWIVSIFSGNIKGQAGMNLIPRFNHFGSYDVFHKMYESFVINRVVYFLLSLVLLLAAAAVFEQKRKGGLGFHGKIS